MHHCLLLLKPSCGNVHDNVTNYHTNNNNNDDDGEDNNNNYNYSNDDDNDNNNNNNDDDDDDGEDNNNNYNYSNDDCNNNGNDNRIERCNSRFFSTISSLSHKLSPTCMLKWPGRNHVKIMCNTSSAYHMQPAVCHLA